MRTYEVVDAGMLDALRWVAQEARAVVMRGGELPRGSRLREALDAMCCEASKDDHEALQRAKALFANLTEEDTGHAGD